MRTHNTPRLCAGPQTAGTPIKFWNVASTGDDEGEITLYGDVVSRQPVDWWTGEPEPGLYIAPESFMEDLAAVKGKSNITIKINSCGGDLYTGIAIHNAIKGLTGHKVVVVEGIAASAASVIACAGDEVQVYYNGRKVIPITEADGPQKFDDELEARLVKEGVAKYIGEQGETAEQTAPTPGDDADEPASTNTAVDEAPEYDEDMKLDELKEVAARYGVDASAMRKKADVIAAIEAAKAEQSDDGTDDEEPPQIGAADPV